MYHAAPGGRRPLDQADQPEPIDPPIGSYIVTTFTIAVYYYSVRTCVPRWRRWRKPRRRTRRCSCQRGRTPEPASAAAPAYRRADSNLRRQCPGPPPRTTAWRPDRQWRGSYVPPRPCERGAANSGATEPATPRSRSAVAVSLSEARCLSAATASDHPIQSINQSINQCEFISDTCRLGHFSNPAHIGHTAGRVTPLATCI